MSYCRFSSESDVYLYGHVEGLFECCSCKLQRFVKNSTMHKSVKLWNLSEVLVHLMKHKKKGHKVPDHALKRVMDEMEAANE